MNSLTILYLPVRFGGVEDVIHPVVLGDGTNLVLVDCGYTGFLPLLEEEMAHHGLSCTSLTHVLITHQDHDHMGALHALKEKYPHIQVAASREEAPYLSGQRKSLRLEQAEALQATLPPEQREFGQAFCALLRQVRPVAVDLVVEGGDRPPWCGGCTVLATPGHTPGHISLYLEAERTIIMGDAAALEHGVPVVANPQFALNLQEAERSLHSLLSLGAEQLICYHGGVLSLLSHQEKG